MKHSTLGIVSFVLSLLTSASLLAMFVIAGVMEARTPGGLEESPAMAIVIGSFVILLAAGTLFAFGFGIAGLLKKDRKRLFAALGTILSGLTLVITVAMILLGHAL